MTSVMVLARVETERRAPEQQVAYDCDPEFIRGLMSGLADRKAGRMYSWNEVKAELGIR